MIPNIELPNYTLKLPSSGRELTVRPFTVKEEKLLLIALETNDENEIVNTTKQVIKNCVVSEELNVNNLPFFDIDYLFIALRAKSVGENIDVKFKCHAIKDDGSECGSVFPVKIDIANCEVKKDESISLEINLSGTTKVKMKYPSYEIMKSLMENDAVINKKIHIISNSIDYIQEKQKYYRTNDIPKEEIIQFIEGLTQEQFKKLENFIDNFPTFVVVAEASCPKCGFQHYIEYKDFTNFFE